MRQLLIEASSWSGVGSVLRKRQTRRARSSCRLSWSAQRTSIPPSHKDRHSLRDRPFLIDGVSAANLVMTRRQKSLHVSEAWVQSTQVREGAMGGRDERHAVVLFHVKGVRTEH